jgi:hypothetical protein
MRVMSTDPAAGARPEENAPDPAPPARPGATTGATVQDDGGRAREAAAAPDGDPAPDAGRQPSWWHRDHPTFAALSGFFTGLVYVVVVPGLFAAVLELVVKDSTAQDLYPFVLVMLALPLVLLVPHRTRRFGLYMLLGIVVTAVVVGGVASLVLWYMVDVHG